MVLPNNRNSNINAPVVVPPLPTVLIHLPSTNINNNIITTIMIRAPPINLTSPEWSQASYHHLLAAWDPTCTPTCLITPQEGEQETWERLHPHPSPLKRSVLLLLKM
eukprot:GFYU01024731.1.p4 GENE.GFYU01024731.1~~GFYU01024731.1.p4  ORF type:complete len:107 (+),score=3.17 GFYU01024731.1:410-730(+)